MAIIFSLLCLFCIFMFIQGMINPEMAVISYAKKGRKQVFMVWFIAGVVCLLLAVTSFYGNPTEQNITLSETTNVEVAAEITAEVTPEPTPTATEVEPTITATDVEPTMDLADLGLSLLIDVYGSRGTVTIDREAQVYNIIFTDHEFENVLALMLLGSETVLQAWDVLVEMISDTSIIMYEYTGYSVALINPNNTEECVLLISDGVILYNYKDELN